MTVHDPKLQAKANRGRDDSRKRRYTLLRQGAGYLTIFHRVEPIQLATVEDAWRAVGDDMRGAFASVAAEKRD